jgi:hypothetical protein
LEPAHNQGCRTAQVDRYDGRRGTPTCRAPDLTGLIDPVRSWLYTGSDR